ncbi:hypothetical protein B0H17DRAFT_1148938 [Mycena rosella]|uniref:Uncharacterized protein n=1 Tax=Mycena rosella TaxID=1033263 RepID=A0AAD7FSI9_MYCRO|nr:hypothetical protein B0H17DRAFT_1148938 [Mycena rosella]
MCTQVARHGRSEAFLSEEQFTDGPLRGLAHVLDKDSHSKAENQLDTAEVARILAVGKELLPASYQLLLQYLRSTGQPWWDCENLPYPEGAVLLPPRAKQPPEFKLDGRTFSCRKSHPGNSAIQFKRPGDNLIVTGFIEVIWEIPLQEQMRTFCVVDLHSVPPPFILQQLPFTMRPHLNTAVVDAQPSRTVCIIKPRHILTHLTVYKRPKGTFGIDRDILTICSSLNRGWRTGD